MERDPQRVSAVLADPTRYRIYQYVLTAPRPVQVPDVARRFAIHPNVARTHLGKLTEIGLVQAQPQKTGKGGRPGYLYAPSGSAVSLSVPARDFHLLAGLLVQSLALLGSAARGAIGEIGRTFGRRLGQEAIATLGYTPRGMEEPMELCAGALRRLGVAAAVMAGEEGRVHLVLRSCGFPEVATAHPEYICHLCKSMVEGITETCLEAAPEVVQAASLPRGDRECVYEVNGLIRLE